MENSTNEISENLQTRLNFGKDKDGYYYPLVRADTFIDQIIGEFCPQFKEIAVYCSSEFPLFMLNDIAEFLGISGKRLRTFKERARKTGEYPYIIDNCKINREQVRYKKAGNFKVNNNVMLTKYGFTALAFISESENALIFETFIHIILDKLEKDKIVHLNEAKESLKTHYEALLLKKSQVLDRTELERDHYIAKTNSAMYKMQRFDGLEACLEDIDVFNATGSLENKMHRYLLETFCHKVEVYIVKQSYVEEKYIQQERKLLAKKKTKKHAPKKVAPKEIFSDSDADSNVDEIYSEVKEDIEEDYEPAKFYIDLCQMRRKYELPDYREEFNEYVKSDFYDDQYYFAFSTFKHTPKDYAIYHKITDIHVLDRKHYDSIIAKFSSDDQHKTLVKNVFKMTWPNLIDAYQCVFGERLIVLRESEKNKQEIFPMPGKVQNTD
jgi:hypothetical protein